MLPEVRLILAVMTAALVVAALGFGLFSRNASVFPIGLHSARGAPLERSLPEPPDWKQFIAHAALRRAEELNRLLDLPNPEPLAAPAESVEQAPAGLPDSGAVSPPDSMVATPETERSLQPSDPTEIPAAAASPSPPPPAAETPAAEDVASASPARMDEPSPAEPAVPQRPEPPAVDVSSVSPSPAIEPPAVEAEVSVVPSPTVEPPPAETALASSQHPESDPPPVDVAVVVPPPPEPEAVPASAEAAPAQAVPTPDAATTLALVSTSAPEEKVEQYTTAAVPLPRPAPPGRNVRHPAPAKAQPPARTKAAHVAHTVNTRAARTRPVGAPDSAPPKPFSGLYQQAHPSE